LPIVGDPDLVARDLDRLAALGLRGIAVSFVNYLEELPYFCTEVLPRLARLGLRGSRAPEPADFEPGR
jgi:alkanesulfonate monooxygenase SsuD/methylene tetrahydromethanopterin reductase-like flavin-dependent oxidoreductase (luciferase family)